MSTKIVVKDIYKIFGKNPEKALELLKEGYSKEEILAQTGLTVGVQDSSFDIMEGEVFVLMGLSGSGKSTLVRMFNRLIEPTAGSIHIDDRDIIGMSEAQLIEMRRREMSMVFQDFALLPNRTVYENASFGLEVAGVSDNQRRERAMEALEAVGLQAYVDSLPQELSGGMQQRVGLARALATDPAVMLMDEAFSALDPLIRTEMQDQLLALQKEHARTVVFVSHDLDEALKIGDRIAIMQEGRVIQVAEPDDILRRPANDYVRAFFRGVDVSQIFTVAHIARRREAVEIEGEDTPAREVLDALNNSESRLAVILDATSKYAGAVTAQSLNAALAGDEQARCHRAFEPKIEPFPKDMVLAEAIEPLAASMGEIPVVDEDRRYIGLVGKSDLLRALKREGDQVSA